MNKLICSLVICLFFLTNCKEEPQGPLEILGNKEVVDGKTIYHSIPDFEFINQDGESINNKNLENHLYLTDFFFTNCPSICPIVKKQMLRIYDKYEDTGIIKIVSHTMDPKRDTPEKLKKYAFNLGVNTSKWMFLTGNKDELLGIAGDYFIAAYEDADAPGGFDHSGKIILVDKNRHIRAFAEGTDPDDVTQLLKDIDRLIEEYAAID